MRIAIIVLSLIFNLFGSVTILKPDKMRDAAVVIFIDSLSYSFVAGEVSAYSKALENESIAPFVLISQWQNPDELKDEIRKLAAEVKVLEGLVLIGDIPIPMVRDAQHMTSAFKIDQKQPRYSLQRTSVPSDRFYDDPDLQWEYLEQDTLNPLLHYYRLTADSPQRIESDFYSGRIKAPGKGAEKYNALKSYLKRVVRQKNIPEKLDKMFVFTGHGYHSEALDAWSSSLLNYRDQFPELFTNGNRFKYFNHAMDPGIKTIILNELQQAQLDLAIFHAHGADDTQYLLGYEPASSIAQNVEGIKLFLRSKLRQAKRRDQSVEEAKKYYIENYNVAEEWFNGAFEDSLIIADSLLSASQDIHLEDIHNLKPGPEFVVFDECYNGAFIHDDYIAGSYVFGSGETIAAMANSVNVLQDQWADHNMGLLPLGIRVGHLVKMNAYLESHIIGDPTFRFEGDEKLKLNTLLASGKVSSKILKKWLKDTRSPVRALAVSLLDDPAEQKLIEFYRTDPAAEVRMQALKRLADTRSEAFEEILFEAAEDNSEFIRRIASVWMGDIGKTEYIPALAGLRIHDPSERVQFNAKSALDQIDPQRSWETCKKQLLELPQSTWRDEELKRSEASFKRTGEWLWDELVKNVEDTSLALKKRISAVRTFRNYRFQQAITNLLTVSLNQDEDEELRAGILEALGWFTFSSQRDKIIGSCKQILNRETESAEMIQSARRTKKRLLEGSNNSITP